MPSALPLAAPYVKNPIAARVKSESTRWVVRWGNVVMRNGVIVHEGYNAARQLMVHGGKRSHKNTSGGYRNLRNGVAVPLILFLLLCLSLSPLHALSSPLEVGSLGERCKLPHWGPGRSPGRKRIRCTLKLSENHCRVEIILNFLRTLFYSTNDQNLALANMTVSDGVSSSPKGGGLARPPLNVTLNTTSPP